jgi:DNA-binding response OmpR family regulator
MNDSEYHPTILIVEDEPIVADTLAKILQQGGYAPYIAYDGESAIEEALLRPPELVIADVILPGMNGVELGLTVRRIFPDCKVILSSGHLHTHDLLTDALSAGNHFVFLQKPVEPKVLLAYVAECLKPRAVFAPAG